MGHKEHHRMDNFYPRPPRGGRLTDRDRISTRQLFLSTPSARRATESGMGLRAVKCISIHALREEGDGSDLHQSTLVGLFLSTPSARRATPTKR